MCCEDNLERGGVGAGNCNVNKDVKAKDFLQVSAKMTVQDLVGKGKTPSHQSLGNLGATFSHLFQKLLADVGETSQLLTTGVLQRFPLIFFFPPLFLTTCVCLASARLTCGLPR